MARGVRKLTGAVLAGSLVLSSTAATAGSMGPSQTIDPWAALTVLSGGGPAAAMCGGAAAAATTQAPGGCVLPVVDAPPPPVQTVEAVPPPPPPVAGAGINPLFFALSAIIIAVGIYAFTRNGGENTVATVPNSAA